MMRKFSLTLLLCLSMGLVTPTAAEAVPLTRAVIRLLRNDVNLIPRGQSSRRASVSDAMAPGDALSTARQSFAEVQFNDGSLARVGESVLFRFAANTRTFRLDNGTMLLLIPPGRGGTRIRTPNATAGIRGSALFVRHEADEDSPEGSVTLVGALTNSEITVCSDGSIEVCGPDSDAEEQVTLEAGQMAAVTDGNITIYEIDLETFYQTSPLAVGLDGSEPTANSGIDPNVIAEINEGLASGAPFPADVSSTVLVTPGFSPSNTASLSAAPVEPDINSPAETVDDALTDGEAIVDILDGEPGRPPIEPPIGPDPEPPIGPDPEPPIGPDPEPPIGPDPEPPIGPDPEPPIGPDPEPPVGPDPEPPIGPDPEPPEDPDPEPPEDPDPAEPDPGIDPGDPDDNPDIDVPPEDDFGDDNNPFNEQFNELIGPGDPDDDPNLDVLPEDEPEGGGNPFNNQFMRNRR